MKGKVNDGALVTLEPCDPDTVAVGDVVLVRVHGTDYLHLVKAIDRGRVSALLERLVAFTTEHAEPRS